MKLGYARVSTGDQNPDLQTDALRAAGCDRIWTEHASGRTLDRPALADLMDHARAGDSIVVWRLDRLGRSLKDLIGLVEEFRAAGIEFVTLTEGLDTTTPGGVFVFHVIAALAQFESDLTRERTRAGLEAARARGHVGGRPAATTAEQRVEALRWLDQGKSVTEVARLLRTSRTTVYRIRETTTSG